MKFRIIYEARNSFVNSLDFLNNESVNVKDIASINDFWFDINRLISDAWFRGIKVEDFQKRFSKLVEDAKKK